MKANKRLLPPLLLLLPVFCFAESVVYDLTRIPYASFLQTSKQVIWTNRKLCDVDSFSGQLKGGWHPSAIPASSVIYDRTPTSCTVQFQAPYLTQCKMVRAYFELSGDNIVGWVDKAGVLKGSDTTAYMGKVAPDSFFVEQPSTTGGNGTYGIFNVETFGDVVQTVSAFPTTADEVIVSNGVLQVDVAENLDVSCPVSGTGGLRFTCPKVPMVTGSFAKYLTTADQKVVDYVDVRDIRVESAVVNGGWCGQIEGAAAYNVTTNLTERSVSMQLQVKHPTNNRRYAVLAVFTQVDDVIMVKATDARKAGDGQDLGSDMTEWTTTAKVATSSGAEGYGIESMVISYPKKPVVVLSGTKGWSGSVTADGVVLRVSGSQLPANTIAKAVNGGTLELGVAHAFGSYVYNSYFIGPGCDVLTKNAYAVTQGDRVDVDGGRFQRGEGGQIYVNNLTLRNGATAGGSGGYYNVGYKAAAHEPTVWISTGSGTNVVEAEIRLVKDKYDTQFGIVAETDLEFRGSVTPKADGMGIAKDGPACVTFCAECRTSGGMTLSQGTVATRSTLTAGTLTLAGSSSLEISQGSVVTFADSSSAEWSSDATLNVTGAFGAQDQTLRFGNSEAALTSAQSRRIRLNGKRCKLDENGWAHEYVSGMTVILR